MGSEGKRERRDEDRERKGEREMKGVKEGKTDGPNIVQSFSQNPELKEDPVGQRVPETLKTQTVGDRC